MTLAQWAEPALLWGNQLPLDRKTPQLLELKSDDFLPEFLTAMKASPDKKTSSNPVAEDFFNKWQMKNPKPNFTLYQPLHSRYYLVTASLVCHQAGLPDKDVNLKKGEKTYFVLRRCLGNVEQGWSDNCGWFNIPDGTTNPKCDETPKEEQFPAHPVSVCTGKDGNVLPCERKIYYGYIATGNREKYLDKQVVNTPSGSGPEAKIKKFFEDANAGVKDVTQKIDYRLDVFDTKVIAAWDMLNRSADPIVINQGSTTVLIEFINFLQKVLPVFWGLLGNATNAGLSTEQTALFDFLNTHNIKKGVPVTLKTALKDPLLKVDDVFDRETLAPPRFGYDVRISAGSYAAQKVVLEALKTAVKGVLEKEQNTSVYYDTEAGTAEERAQLLENQVRPVPVEGAVDSYFVRMAYEYDPECPPIYSIESSPFTFARNLEPDAPARLIRIEMPSIKPRDLRKFRHGVGMQLSPELRKVMDGVHEGMLDKEGLKDSTGWELGMICTFSIQIITLIAFVVMFIFAILLNIVFWWLAFLKICFPIPKKA